MRITIGNAKGGVAKSTTALYLAVGWQRAGARVLLVDADPTNQSLMEWSRAADCQWPSGIVVVPWQDLSLGRRVAALAGDFDHTIIDTGPESLALLKQALLVTDHLLVPVGPTPTELRQLAITLGTAAEVDQVRPLQVRILLTRVTARARSRRAARRYLAELGIDTMATEVRRLEAVPMAWGTVDFDLGDYAGVLAELADRAPAAAAAGGAR